MAPQGTAAPRLGTTAVDHGPLAAKQWVYLEEQWFLIFPTSGTHILKDIGLRPLVCAVYKGGALLK